MPRRVEDEDAADVVPTETLDLKMLEELDDTLDPLEAGNEERSYETAGDGVDPPTLDIENAPGPSAANGFDGDVVSK